MPQDKTARILIQTDHPNHCDFLRPHLEQMGHSLTFADTADTLLAILNCEAFDLLILDAGRADIIEKIRHELHCDAPIITLVGPNEIDLAERSIEHGAQDYLREPLNPTLLKVRVAGCLDQLWWKRGLAERERLMHLEHDVEIARRIQNNFLPRELPSVPGWEFEARFFPARVVAGDWYDMFYLSNKRRVGFVIADVCDKGLPSALFMSLCRSLIRAFAQQNTSLSWMGTQQFKSDDWLKYVKGNAHNVREEGKPLDEVDEFEDRQRNLPSAGTTALKTAVTMTNAYVLENHAESNMFATLFFGLLDPRSGVVAYINAGHNPPALINSAGQIKARLKPTGPAIGIVPNANFEMGHLTLDPGDVLYCFTDGVPDATNPSGEHFGEKRLMALLQQPGLTAGSAIKLVQDTIHQHTLKAVQFDDVTMIAVHRQ